VRVLSDKTGIGRLVYDNNLHIGCNLVRHGQKNVWVFSKDLSHKPRQNFPLSDTFEISIDFDSSSVDHTHLTTS
jgi:hypothetical protein